MANSKHRLSVQVLTYCMKLDKSIAFPHAHFTLADPMPRLASDVVGGKSRQNHPTSRRDPIHIGRMSRNAYIRVGWYGEGVLFEPAQA